LQLTQRLWVQIVDIQHLVPGLLLRIERGLLVGLIEGKPGMNIARWNVARAMRKRRHAGPRYRQKSDSGAQAQCYPQQGVALAHAGDKSREAAWR
jgi:hypothetical protein